LIKASISQSIPASAQIISRWIKYHEKLHDISPEYNVKTQNPEIFKAFSIKPKVCDWLSRCTDVQIQENLKEKTDKFKAYNFKFENFNNTPYIKLLFYIEYFNPKAIKNVLNDYKVEFDLKLIHFGDPCFQKDKCQNGAVCESSNTESIPNDLKCLCNQNSTQSGLCEETDHCNIKNGSKVNFTFNFHFDCYESMFTLAIFL
jgi:hypothetical protein